MWISVALSTPKAGDPQKKLPAVSIHSSRALEGTTCRTSRIFVGKRSITMPRNDDDIVFTLSDNDDVDVSDFSEPETAPEQKSTKRKRDERPAPKSKKQKLKQDESEGEENALGLKDDALDSDFEFEVGANRLDDQLEEFDGWGDASRDSRSAKKRGVDLDDIIARRQKKDSTSPQSEKHPVDKAEQGSQEADTEDREEDEVDSDHEDAPAIDFDNDELLADDAFGAAAESEEDGPSDADEAADDDASDNDSVASPTAHPEDEATDDDASTDNTSPDSDVEEEAKRAAFFAPESKDKVASAKSFQQFSLSRPILRAVATLNSPTPTTDRQHHAQCASKLPLSPSTDAAPAMPNSTARYRPHAAAAAAAACVVEAVLSRFVDWIVHQRRSRVGDVERKRSDDDVAGRNY